jgi:L-2,4-diaminobutyrate transaminase
MTGSLTGLELFHKKFDLPLTQVIHTEAPYYFRREDAARGGGVLRPLRRRSGGADRAEGADTIAAFIGEPMLGTGGIVPPPAGYWEAIQPS